MTSAFLITLREGVEAALIVGIIFAYLNVIDRRDWFRYVWAGTGLAIVLSLAIGVAAFLITGSLSNYWAQMIEGAGSLLAVGVLTYMIFWMRKQARHIKGELHSKIDKAVALASPMAMSMLAFAAVGREGFETVLFMFALIKSSSMLAAGLGGLMGLSLASVIGYLIYKGGVRLNLRVFFNVTSFLIILFAAGLLSYGVRELQALGALPPLVRNIWDLNFILNERRGLGAVLSIVFNYNANPSLMEASFYLTYLIGALTYYFRPERVAPRIAAERVSEKA